MKSFIKLSYKNMVGMQFGNWIVLDKYIPGTKVPKRGAKYLCRCICGVEKLISVSNLIEGISRSCGCSFHSGRTRKGSSHPAWKGGRWLNEKKGYIVIWDPESKTGHSYEHRWVMSKHLGRPLEPYESVHHKNGIKDDNRIENLELCTGRHPDGHRVEDLTVFSIEHLRKYKPEALNSSLL